MKSDNELEFCGYRIREFNKDSFWIDFPSGEGMGITKEDLAEWFERIYQEDF